jgi:hypothetical protein
VLKYALGPQVLCYADGDDITTTCGVLMGMPLSWVTLNLMHLYWVDTAALRADKDIKTVYKRTRICGDDLLG